ncbi:aldehyde dehydrogenase family protein [Streptomyces sp. L7]
MEAVPIPAMPPPPRAADRAASYLDAGGTPTMTRHDDRTATAVPAEAPSSTAIAVERLVTNGLKALADYESLDQERVDHIVKKASVAALDQHTALARLAVEETGRGVFEDKAAKNMFACEHVTYSMGTMKTVGVIARDDIDDMIEVAEPVGVVCAITPVTNLTSTTIFKALMALKTRNPVVFAFHPPPSAAARRPPAWCVTPPSPPARPSTASSGSRHRPSRPPAHSCATRASP